jgi:phosphinothricin acetyltransferase
MITEQVQIRHPTARDLRAVVHIYNGGIAERIATFETEPRTVDDIAGWLEDGQPFLVAGREGRVVGWARANAYSDRCVYRGVGEHAVYVSPSARGQGLGSRLLIELCAEAERLGLYKLTSRVFADNLPSLAAHRTAGFEEVGIQRRHGKLGQEWKDCVLVERLLGDQPLSERPRKSGRCLGSAMAARDRPRRAVRVRPAVLAPTFVSSSAHGASTAMGLTTRWPVGRGLLTGVRLPRPRVCGASEVRRV